MGGVAAGVFTATESSAIACVYTFIITYLVFRTAKFLQLWPCAAPVPEDPAIVMTLIATAAFA